MAKSKIKGFKEPNINKKQFRHFETIRQSGMYNMLDGRVAKEMGISQTEHVHLLRNYDHYSKKYTSKNKK